MSATSTLRKTYTALWSEWMRLQLKRHPVRFDGNVCASPTVYFLTPDHDRPAGGIKVIYDHVDILNNNGIAACVLHTAPNFRCSWFDNATRVGSISAVSLHANDLLVIPEVGVSRLSYLPVGVRHVVFNQNAHLTWQRGGPALSAYPARESFLGYLTVSEHNRRYLQLAYPDARVARIRLGIDSRLFNPDGPDRPPRITYMPRRSREDATQVLEILKGANSLQGWEVVALDGLPHYEVARQLKASRIFLAFTKHEGFGLPAAEAMACGNYVIGNHGFGGAEFFLDEFSRPIETGNILEFARAVAEAVHMEASSPGWCQRRGRLASNYVLRTYALENQVRDVVGYYSALMQPAPQAGSASEAAHGNGRRVGAY